jgi:hypothetical protein
MRSVIAAAAMQLHFLQQLSGALLGEDRYGRRLVLHGGAALGLFREIPDSVGLFDQLRCLSRLLDRCERLLDALDERDDLRRRGILLDGQSHCASFWWRNCSMQADDGSPAQPPGSWYNTPVRPFFGLSERTFWSIWRGAAIGWIVGLTGMLAWAFWR